MNFNYKHSNKNNLIDKSNKKTKNIRNYHKSEYANDQNCNDLGTSSSTLITDIHTDLPNRNIHSSGSVDKRSLIIGHAKSSPCIECGKGDNTPIIHAHNSRGHKPRSKISYHNYLEDDIDFIPVKLVSSERNLITTENMKGLRQNITRSPDKRINSWGKILKEQNVKEPSVSKDKKTGSGVLNNISNRTAKNVPLRETVTNRSQPIKEKHVTYEPSQSCNQTVKNSKVSTPNSSNSSDKLSYTKGKHSKVNIKHNEPAYSDSTSTITGESIMLVDRSVQYSSTTLDLDNKWHRNLDVNQAGDNGLAYFNPIRTLNFLVRELRGKLSEGKDENMARIIRDMENTISRLSSSSSSQHVIDNNWNTLISEDDLKYVLDLLQNPIQIPTRPAVENDKNTVELQFKLEQTCSKLESICTQMERAACTKLKEDKEALINELKDKNQQCEIITGRLHAQEMTLKDLKKKTEEQSKIITSLKETNSKSSALNKILNEQLDDTEKKYQQLVTEMQFLILEKEKNIVLMKSKDKDLMDLRKNLEDIKALVIEQLSISLQGTDSGGNLRKSQMEFDNLTIVSALSNTVMQSANVNNTDTNKTIVNALPKCSSPTDTVSPSPEDDESWRKLSNVPMTTSVSQAQMPQVQSLPNKATCIKESLKNMLEEMKQQTMLSKNLSVQNLINLDDATRMSNWSDLDISDEDLQSAGGFLVSDTEINF